MRHPAARAVAGLRAAPARRDAATRSTSHSGGSRRATRTACSGSSPRNARGSPSAAFPVAEAPAGCAGARAGTTSPSSSASTRTSCGTSSRRTRTRRGCARGPRARRTRMSTGSRGPRGSPELPASGPCAGRSSGSSAASRRRRTSSASSPTSAPDVLLVTHLAELGSSQSDYVRAAARLGVHTGYPVFSWDNLTNKGLVHDAARAGAGLERPAGDGGRRAPGHPARARRASRAPRPTTTGSSGQPSRSREELCREVGLRADRPIILYVCSSHFIAPDEVGFIRRWVGALRAHGGALAEAGVIVRPHPRNAAQWGRVDPRLPQVAGLAPLRRGAARGVVAAELLRLDLPLRRRRRDQHERPDRERDRRPPGAHRPRGRVPRDPAGHAALPVPEGRRLRPPLRRPDDGGAPRRSSTRRFAAMPTQAATSASCGASSGRSDWT